MRDKILEPAFDYGTPLTAISASPPECFAGRIRSETITSGEFEDRATYDSIMDSLHELQKTTVEDSIFAKIGNRTSVSLSGSMLFGENSEGHNLRYRPILSFRITGEHGPVKENNTMIHVVHQRFTGKCSNIDIDIASTSDASQSTQRLTPRPAFVWRDARTCRRIFRSRSSNPAKETENFNKPHVI